MKSAARWAALLAVVAVLLFIAAVWLPGHDLDIWQRLAATGSLLLGCALVLGFSSAS